RIQYTITNTQTHGQNRQNILARPHRRGRRTNKGFLLRRSRTFEEVSLGDYDDYNMLEPEDKEVAAGICHKRCVNKNIPSQWLNYVMVENIDTSVASCLARGGKVVDGPRKTGKSMIAAVIKF